MLTIIGAGNMGGAMAKMLVEKGFCTPETICIVDMSEEKLDFFERKGCMTTTNAADVLPQSSIVLLATKPQILRTLLDEWKPLFSSDVLLLSIAAGVSEDDIISHSGAVKVVRIMPNTPLLVGKGICGWHASEKVSSTEKEIVQKMLNCFGLSVPCQTEDQIDSITALSGSGPAYYFYLLEHAKIQAEEFGFSEEIAKEIAMQTLLGAGFLAEQSEEDFETLRKNITSPGGTTAAAIEYFEENNLGEIWKNGIKSAYQRAKEL